LDADRAPQLKAVVRAHRVLERQQPSARLDATPPPRGDTSSERGLVHLNVFGFPSPRSPVSATEKAGESYNPTALEQSLAADGAIACFSSSLIPSA
jgi:hypothetical protein